jgi:lysophospholipase L1-like esterase
LKICDTSKFSNTFDLIYPLFTQEGWSEPVIGKPFRSYVAIGDSLSEGLGDFTFDLNRHGNGWTDRLAGILAKEADDKGFDFEYANLAIRGANLQKIISCQLPRALALQPDLVTVMAGSNDLLTREDKLPGLRAIYREGIQSLRAAGCDVVVANTINPLHLRVFKPLRYRAERFSEMIGDVADELGVPVLDVFGIEEFSDLLFWAQDMVHFSGYGHVAVANQAATILDLSYRFAEPPRELGPVTRSVSETLTWFFRDVIPFVERRIRGVTSGDGLEPKHPKLESYRPKAEYLNWELIRT